MNLPKILANLVIAQTSHDSIAYAHCFSETAVVLDEGHTYNGRMEIEHWIAKANEKYKTVMKPITYEEQESKSILTAENSGTFDGSPIILNYIFEIKNGLIQSLKVA